MATAGTYHLSAGNVFYIGSSTNIVQRRRDHAWRLKSGKHHLQKLQAAFNTTGSISFTPLEFFTQKNRESDQDFRNRIRAAEQKLLDFHRENPNLANMSTNSLGPDNGELIKKLWEDPEYRAAAVKRLAQVATNPSAETRTKMADAKRGAKNKRSRAVIVTNPDGSKTRFDCTSDAAKFFGVSQQLFDTWVKKTAPWPGAGKYVRKAHVWIASYSAEYA